MLGIDDKALKKRIARDDGERRNPTTDGIGEEQ